MPDWLTILLTVVGVVGGAVGALGGFGGFVAWRQFRQQAPISTQEAMHRSFERQIAWEEKRRDAAARGAAQEERLCWEAGEQEEAWRAQQGVGSRASPGPLTVGQPIQLAPEELAELQRLLQASQPLLMVSVQDYLSRGNAYFQVGDYGQALVAFDRAIALRPGYPEVHTSRGAALGNLGRHEQALAAYDRAIALRPDDPEAHTNRGAALGRLGRYQEALEACERALALKPDLVGAIYNKACALSRLARWNEALEWLERAIGGDRKNRELARTDPDFQHLREHPEHGLRFWALVGQQ